MENIGDDRENLNDFLEEAELGQYYESFRDVLKVTKVSQLKFVATEDLVQIGLSKPEQRRYKKIFSKYFPNPYLTRIKKLLGANKKQDQNPHGSNSFPLEILPYPENNVKVPTKHIISIEDISINKELGMGQFGVVQQGIWTTGNQRLQVAIKCLGHERLTSNSTEFLKEAAVMHSIEHPNIVRLYGVVLHLDSLMLVTELAPLRSLLECLREPSLRLNFPVPNLCEFAEQICDGMTYLEDKRLIHRDLAARNILVFSKDRVKISDFGLSRALGVGKDYYQTNYNVNLKLPVAWCAPECILYLRFTSASDVWAFGVCLWEMFTYGFQPWAAFSGQQILETIDAPNYQRLERPECCPEAYYLAMLECWLHEPNIRPKFKDLGQKLRDIRPDQVKALSTYSKPEDGRRTNMLEYKAGQFITVLGKENMTDCALWYGVLPGGACGMFDPCEVQPVLHKSEPLASLSPHPLRQSSRSIRSSLLRSDVKRHTYTGKRTLQRSMISSPQGDVKHTGHVGLDGAYFGDVSFLDQAGCPPRQIVTPYKPSEDLEEMPLINPNSPSHMTGACSLPYPLLASNANGRNGDELDLQYGDKRSKSSRKSSFKSNMEPTTSRSLLNKVRSMTLDRSHKTDDNAAAKTDEVHEYHEISDTDTESNATDNVKSDNSTVPESPGLPKSSGDFSQSILDEMESMFKNLDGSKKDVSGASAKLDIDLAISILEKKKGFHTGTMKPMSAHDQKTLDTAVAMANEITSKSMNDLDGDVKKPNSPSDRTKFHFKFPHLSLHHHTQHGTEKDNTAKQERRNFSEEANSVPDIQSTITEESKQAYSSLIERPIPSSSLISHIGKGANGMKKPLTMPKPVTLPKSAAMPPPLTMPKPTYMPKPAPRPIETRISHFHSLQKHLPYNYRHSSVVNGEDLAIPGCSKNVLPLPPRSTKPKLVDKPRHFRKYPLKLPMPLPTGVPTEVAIYQNAMVPPKPATADACVSTTPDIDPFNPFDTDLEDTLEYKDGSNEDDDEEVEENKKHKGKLVKDCTDHVSVEDLLEFADHKPCGRQRGVESDEVRIMNKVLRQVTPEECLQALEMCEWDVHLAIKLLNVKNSTEVQTTLEECSVQLANANGDLTKAVTALVFNKTD